MKTLTLTEMECLKGGDGKRAVDCIKDAYENHGWGSFALWVGTLIDPMIGVSVGAGCAVVGLVQN